MGFFDELKPSCLANDKFDKAYSASIQKVIKTSNLYLRVTTQSRHMFKLCLNSRDELLIIDLEKIAYFQANGNYTHLSYISGDTHLLTIGLTKVEEYIRRTWPMATPSPFVRLGRSLIINQRYLTEISILKQKLILSDNDGHSFALNVPKPLLKEYKEKINEFYQNKPNN